MLVPLHLRHSSEAAFEATVPLSLSGAGGDLDT